MNYNTISYYQLSDKEDIDMIWESVRAVYPIDYTLMVAGNSGLTVGSNTLYTTNYNKINSIYNPHKPKIAKIKPHLAKMATAELREYVKQLRLLQCQTDQMEETRWE